MVKQNRSPHVSIERLLTGMHEAYKDELTRMKQTNIIVVKRNCSLQGPTSHLGVMHAPAVLEGKDVQTSTPRVLTHGCGSKNRYQNGTLASGNLDQNLRFAPPV